MAISSMKVRTTTIEIPQGPFLLIYFNFNPNMEKQLHPLKSVGWNYFFPNFNGAKFQNE